MVNLIKKYKIVKDKCRIIGYGKGGDDEDKEIESEIELILKNFNDIDNILGKWEVVNFKYVLESSLYIINDKVVVFVKLLFFKNKSRKRKGISIIMFNLKSCVGKKLVKKNFIKKVKGGVGVKE